MGKSVSATDLLRAGRDRTRNDSGPRTTDADNSTKRLVDPLPSRVSDEATRRLDAQSSRHSDAETSSGPGVSASSSGVSSSGTYQRATVFLTPDQRRWLKQTARALPVDGLSASDIVRLALNRLRQDLEGELDLVEVLSRQAHAEAATLTGRRNRGLPPRERDSA